LLSLGPKTILNPRKRQEETKRNINDGLNSNTKKLQMRIGKTTLKDSKRPSMKLTANGFIFP
jgi:hypothetical protein